MIESIIIAALNRIIMLTIWHTCENLHCIDKKGAKIVHASVRWLGFCATFIERTLVVPTQVIEKQFIAIRF